MYGGTKTEMERLIADAAKLDSSIQANDLSFGNIVKAINVVQTEMGITGTTALEAGRTISGSVGAMKSAWTNLVTGFADGNADIEGLINNLVKTIVGDGTENNLGVIGNVLPAIETALGGIAKLIEGAAPKIIEILPGLVERVVPSVISAATGMVNAVVKVVPDLLDTVVDAIIDNAPALIDSAIVLIGELSSGILGQLPQIVKLGLDLIVSLANGIAENLPQLVPTIIDVILQIVNILTDPANWSALIDASIAIILALADGLIEALPTLIDAIPTIIENLVIAIIENAPQILSAGWELTFALIEGIISAIPNLLETSQTLAQSLAEYITTPENLEKLISLGGELINALSEGIENVVAELVSVGVKVVESIKSGIYSAWGGLVSWFNELWNSLFGNRTVNVHVDATHSGAGGSFAKGLTYVPYDGFIAELHRGERVLTAKENREYYDTKSDNSNTSGITIIQNIQSVPQTPVELAAATEAYFEQARWAFA